MEVKPPKILNLTEGITELKKELEKGQLITFVGSGMSIKPPSNLPDWDNFIMKFIEFCSTISDALDNEIKKDFDNIISDAITYKSKSHTKVASVLMDKLNEIHKGSDINIDSALKGWFIENFSTSNYNSNHKYIAETAYPYILTSNYDMLIEKALKASNFNKLANRTFTFTEADKIASSLFSKRSCIIHIHGKYQDIILDNIVFTSDDYTKMLRREYPGFTMTIQNLFTNYSTLFLGYGGSDPHLEDLLEEHSYYLKYSNLNLPKNYMVVLEKDANRILSEYKFKRRTNLIKIKNFDDYDILLSSLQKSYPRKKTDSQ